ncbi:MAG: proline racemase family protein [Acidobacteriaceae bacterium]
MGLVDSQPATPAARVFHASVPSSGCVMRDVAWSGYRIFQVEKATVDRTPGNGGNLRKHAWSIRRALLQNTITSRERVAIAPIQFPAPSTSTDNRNIGLCSGNAFHRSSAEIRTRAKLPCLAANSGLAPCQTWWRQGRPSERRAEYRLLASLGRAFDVSYRIRKSASDHVLPSLPGWTCVAEPGQPLFPPEDGVQDGMGR